MEQDGAAPSGCNTPLREASSLDEDSRGEAVAGGWQLQRKEHRRQQRQDSSKQRGQRQPGSKPRQSTQQRPQATQRQGDSEAPDNRPHRKRLSGAEIKRRRRARLAANASQTSSQGQVTSITPCTSSKKRVRSDGSGPSPHQASKRSMSDRPPQELSYREAAMRHLKVVIIDRATPLGKINKAQSDHIMSLLTAELDRYLSQASASTSIPPTFRGWFYSGEFLRLTCSDDQTLGWLRKAVANIRAPWPGARLDVAAAEELPKLVKAAMFIPGVPDETSAVIRRLAAQNQWAKVHEWCVFHDSVKEQPQGRLLVFGITESMGALICEKGGRLSYLFSSLRINVRKAVDNATASANNKPTTSPAGAVLGESSRMTSSQSTEGSDQTVVDVDVALMEGLLLESSEGDPDM